MKTINNLNYNTYSHQRTIEDEILIHCARVNMSAERLELLKSLLAEGPDWDLLIEKANYHRVGCLVSHHLRSEELKEYVPQPVVQIYHNIYYSSLAKNMLLQNGLSQLLTSFNKEGIPNIVLKGAAMLGNVYEDISLRPMGDLDILIHPDYLDKAMDIALSCGYSHFHSPYSQETAREKLRHLDTLWNDEKQITLELHQHIEDADSPYNFDLGGFWNRAKEVTILDSKTLVFAPEDLLIHLSLNFMRDRHYNSRHSIGQLTDISEIITYYGESLNWNLIETTAKELSIEPTLHCTLYVCKQLLDTNMPQRLLSNLQPSEFDSAIFNLFIIRRILDTKGWVRFDWMTPKKEYNSYNAVQAIILRILHIPIKVYRESGFRKRKLEYYKIMIGRMVPDLVKRFTKPSRVKEDIMLERWLHNLNNDGKSILR